MGPEMTDLAVKKELVKDGRDRSVGSGKRKLASRRFTELKPVTKRANISYADAVKIVERYRSGQ